MSNKKNNRTHSPVEVEPNNAPPAGAGAVAAVVVVLPPNENPPPPPAEEAAGTAGAPNPLNGGGFTAGF